MSHATKRLSRTEAARIARTHINSLWDTLKPKESEASSSAFTPVLPHIQRQPSVVTASTVQPHPNTNSRAAHDAIENIAAPSGHLSPDVIPTALSEVQAGALSPPPPIYSDVVLQDRDSALQTIPSSSQILLESAIESAPQVQQQTFGSRTSSRSSSVQRHEASSSAMLSNSEAAIPPANDADSNAIVPDLGQKSTFAITSSGGPSRAHSRQPSHQSEHSSTDITAPVASHAPTIDPVLPSRASSRRSSARSDYASPAVEAALEPARIDESSEYLVVNGNQATGVSTVVLPPRSQFSGYRKPALRSEVLKQFKRFHEHDIPEEAPTPQQPILTISPTPEQPAPAAASMTDQHEPDVVPDDPIERRIYEVRKRIAAEKKRLADSMHFAQNADWRPKQPEANDSTALHKSEIPSHEQQAPELYKFLHDRDPPSPPASQLVEPAPPRPSYLEQYPFPRPVEELLNIKPTDSVADDKRKFLDTIARLDKILANGSALPPQPEPEPHVNPFINDIPSWLRDDDRRSKKPDPVDSSLRRKRLAFFDRAVDTYNDLNAIENPELSSTLTAKKTTHRGERPSPIQIIVSEPEDDQVNRAESPVSRNSPILLTGAQPILTKPAVQAKSPDVQISRQVSATSEIDAFERARRALKTRSRSPSPSPASHPASHPASYTPPEPIVLGGSRSTQAGIHRATSAQAAHDPRGSRHIRKPIPEKAASTSHEDVIERIKSQVEASHQLLLEESANLEKSHRRDELAKTQAAERDMELKAQKARQQEEDAIRAAIQEAYDAVARKSGEKDEICI